MRVHVCAIAVLTVLCSTAGVEDPPVRMSYWPSLSGWLVRGYAAESSSALPSGGETVPVFAGWRIGLLQGRRIVLAVSSADAGASGNVLAQFVRKSGNGMELQAQIYLPDRGGTGCAKIILSDSPNGVDAVMSYSRFAFGVLPGVDFDTVSVFSECDLAVDSIFIGQ